MGLFTYIFGRKEPASDSGPQVAPRTPPRLSHMEDWCPPRARHVPARCHVEALIRLFQQEGSAGAAVPHWQLVASYAECAWVQGYVQISERQLLAALGQVCAKVRRNVDHGDGKMTRAICYVIPAPDEQGDATNVLPYRNKRAGKGPHRHQSARSGTAARKQFASNSQILGQGKGGRYSADIEGAAA